MATAPRTLVLWGERGSGKSGVVGALRSEAVKTVGERWSIELADAERDASEFAESASLALRLRDVKDTAVRRRAQSITLPLKRYSGARVEQELQLSVLDPQGTVARSPVGLAARTVVSAVSTADGLLWLLEVPRPEEAGQSLDRITLLYQVVAMLEAARVSQIDIPVVVALSKLDRLPAAEMRTALERPEALLREQIGDAAFGWLLAAFPRLRCFGLSAAGTVRNAARPIGLTAILDSFVEEWNRDTREAQAARARERRSARLAKVRRRTPLVALGVAAAALVITAGVAAARRLTQRSATWSASAGSVVTQAAIPAPRPRSAETLALRPNALAAASEAYQRGDAKAALLALKDLQVPPTSPERASADSLVALASLRGTADALNGTAPDSTALPLVVSMTSDAIERAQPGSYRLALLSLARAGACVGGRLGCADEQVREDLAWVLLLGTDEQQDEARRLRAAWRGDTTRARL
jgi:hypothetical protein